LHVRLEIIPNKQDLVSRYAQFSHEPSEDRRVGLPVSQLT
jgi:hypothetical protein